MSMLIRAALRGPGKVKQRLTEVLVVVHTGGRARLARVVAARAAVLVVL